MDIHKVILAPLVLLLGVALATPATGMTPAEERAVMEAIVAEHLAPTLAPFRATLMLDKKTYQIGEPIIGTYRVENLDVVPRGMGSAGGSRGGRPMFLRVGMTDESGAGVADPFRFIQFFMMQGGINGGGGIIEPGKFRDTPVLVNLYRRPTTPGVHQVTVGNYLDYPEGKIETSPARFRLLNEICDIDTAEETLRAHGMEYYIARLPGIQGRANMIPKLVKTVALSHRRSDTEKEREERAASSAAFLSLGMMPHKRRVLEELLPYLSRIKIEDDARTRVHALFTASTDETTLPYVESLMDHRDKATRDLAFLSALERGSAKALARYPQEAEGPEGWRAWDAAKNFLWMSDPEPDPPTIKAPDALRRAYADALLASFSDPVATTPRSRDDRLGSLMITGYYVEAFLRVYDAASSEDRPAMLDKFAGLVISPGFLSKIPREAAETLLIPRLVEILASAPDEESRGNAAVGLAVVESGAGIEATRELLRSKSESVRLNAAIALLMLRDAPSREASLAIAGRPYRGPANARIGGLLHQLGVRHAYRFKTVVDDFQKNIPDNVDWWRLQAGVVDLLIRSAVAKHNGEPLPLDAPMPPGPDRSTWKCANDHLSGDRDLKWNWSIPFGICPNCGEQFLPPPTPTPAPNVHHFRGSKYF